MSSLFINSTIIAQTLELTAAGANLKNALPRMACVMSNPAQTPTLKFIIEPYNKIKIIFAGSTHMRNGIKNYGKAHVKEFAGAGGSAHCISRNDIDTGKVTVRKILKPRAIDE
jgi:hypothetical protein